MDSSHRASVKMARVSCFKTPYRPVVIAQVIFKLFSIVKYSLCHCN